MKNINNHQITVQNYQGTAKNDQDPNRLFILYFSIKKWQHWKHIENQCFKLWMWAFKKIFVNLRFSVIFNQVSFDWQSWYNLQLYYSWKEHLHTRPAKYNLHLCKSIQKFSIITASFTHFFFLKIRVLLLSGFRIQIKFGNLT